MRIQFILLIVTLIILPVYLAVSLWKSRENSKVKWLVRTIYSGGFVLFFVLVGRWDWIGYPLRYLALALYALAALASYRKVKAQPLLAETGGRGWRAYAGNAFELVMMFGFLGLTLRGFFYPAQMAVDLAFPLEDGRYYVAQGGNFPLLNYHNTHPTQRYALDIVALNPLGLRASGTNPGDLEKYEIYGKTLYSPCDGVVLEAVDNLPDLIPPATDRENPPGNYVVIGCRDVRVVLAHMKPGSLMAGEGDPVSAGQPLGQVGNSGNTSEPHLHIHAEKPVPGSAFGNEGVPMRFNGRFPVRNTVFVRGER